jgi:hypothetical protein
VRVWWPPVNNWGQTVYPTFGFILPRPAGSSTPPSTPSGEPMAANGSDLRLAAGS